MSCVAFVFDEIEEIITDVEPQLPHYFGHNIFLLRTAISRWVRSPAELSKDKKTCIAVLWPFLWIGSFSLHPKIGGYLYSKTVFPYMAFTFIVEFTKTLNAACLERPYRHLPPEFEILLPLFPTFCLAFIANIHRFRWKEWRTSTLVEFDLSDIVVYLKQLSLLILIQKTDDDVDVELHEMFLVVVQCLYIITGYAARADWDDKASKYHTICIEKTANMLRRFKKNEMKIHRRNQLMMQCTETPIIDEIHASVQTLFDPNPINQARFSIYKQIATRSNECRAVLDVQCGCGNVKCSKG